MYLHEKIETLPRKELEELQFERFKKARNNLGFNQKRIGEQSMTDTTIAEIILAVIIVVGLIINCLIGVANIKALNRIEIADKKADEETDKSEK